MTVEQILERVAQIRNAKRIMVLGKVHTITNANQGTFKNMELVGPRGAKKIIRLPNEIFLSYQKEKGDVFSYSSADFTRMDTKYYRLDKIEIVD